MDGEKKGWFDEPRHVEWLFRALCIVCTALVVADLFLTEDGHFRWEGWLAFYGIYGFVACVLLVLTAKQMRKVVRRDEDFYDR